MLNQLLTSLTARTVMVAIAVITVVVVVPITVLSVAPGDDTARSVSGAASGARSHPATTPMVPASVRFKSEADDLIAALGTAEAACEVSVSKLIAESHLPAGLTKPILALARIRLDAGVQPLIGVVQRDEDSAALVITLLPELLATYVADIDTIRLVALGTGGQSGSFAILCSTVIVQVKQEIATLDVPPGDGSQGGD